MITFRENEHLITVYKRHPIVLWLGMAPIVLFAVLIAAIVIALIAWLPGSLSPLIPLILFCGIIFLHLLWVSVWVMLANYFMDIWILTSDRLMMVQLKGLFSREVSEFALEKIQDVTVDVRGLLGVILDYGDINLRTASEDAGFTFARVAHPSAVKDQIANACFERVKLVHIDVSSV